MTSIYSEVTPLTGFNGDSPDLLISMYLRVSSVISLAHKLISIRFSTGQTLGGHLLVPHTVATLGEITFHHALLLAVETR